MLNYQIITSEGATVASTVTYLLPIVAIVLGVLVLGEHITLPVIAGIALILAGVALTRTHAQPVPAQTEGDPSTPTKTIKHLYRRRQTFKHQPEPVRPAISELQQVTGDAQESSVPSVGFLWGHRQGVGLWGFCGP